MNQLSNKRDYKIDILRFIGLICIILAHTSPPGIIFFIRNFDVTLMVMLMGTSYYLSSNGKKINYFNYIKKRFNRLVIPTWTFLSIFFIIFYIISLIINVKYQFKLRTILESYFLINGIGYVWIIRVYFLISILNPIIFRLSEKIKKNYQYFMLLFLVYFVYLILISINNNLYGISNLIFDNIIISSIGWGLIAAIGIRIKKLSKRELILYSLIFMFIFISLMIKYDFSSTQNYKYPPTMYYMSYGIFISFILIIILDNIYIYDIFNNKFVKNISTNSLWLYFWHIIPVYIINLYGNYIPLINYNFITRFIFIFIFTILTTFIHKNIKNLLFKFTKSIKIKEINL